MKKREIISTSVIIILIFIIPFLSAGFFGDAWDKITGRLTSQNVSLNITVSNAPPTIYNVTFSSPIILTDAPSSTSVIINFSATDPDGASNLNNASAAINLTRSGQPLRYNSSCAVKDFSANWSNYTCKITMWWFDQDGAWTIYANISDLNGNIAVNGTHTVSVNTLTGFVMSPSTLNFSNLVAGTYNNTPINHLTLNNTGNDNITSTNVRVNATDLVGESNPGRFIFAGNFSASPYTGNKIECNITASATQLQNETFTGVTSVVLNAGNYTKSNGEGQEELYFCLREVGTELTQQQYSTYKLGNWIVDIVT
jgi:hypothetical protein